MAIENTPPTADDYLKRQEIAAAEASALKAEKERIEAQFALDEAKKKLNSTLVPPDSSARAVASAKVAKEVAEAETALAEARLATFKAKYGGVPDTSIAGDMALGDKAGTLEMTLLSHRALADAAKTIAEAVLAKLTTPHATGANSVDGKSITLPIKLYLYPLAQLPNFQAVANFAVQRDAVMVALDQASMAAKSAISESAGETTKEAVTTAMVGVALESITKLLGFFRSDYKIGGSEITLDDIALVQAVAGQDLPGNVIVPVLYYPQAVRDAALLVRTELQELSKQMKQAMDLASQLEQLITKKQIDAATASAAGKKASAEGEIGRLRTLIDRLKTATGAYDTLLNRLMAPDEATGAMLRDLAVWNGLNDRDGRLLLLKVQKAGGSYYTEKNLWNFFGKMPFYVAGGVVVSYTLLKGEDGTVLASGLLPVHGGFEQVKQVPMQLPASH